MKTPIRILLAIIAIFVVAGIATAQQPAANTIASIEKLERAGVIDSFGAAYLKQTAVQGRMVDGPRVADLLIAASKTLGNTGDTVEVAVNFLVTQKIITTPGNWVANSQPGKQQAGSTVAIVIRRLADRIHAPAPATSATKTAVPADTRIASIEKLQKARVITAGQADYFKQNGVKGRMVDGPMAADLIIASAKKLGCENATLEASVKHLAKLNIIGATASWLEFARPGKQLAGSLLEIIIPRIAGKID